MHIICFFYVINKKKEIINSEIKKELLSGCPLLYQSNLLEHGVQTVVKSNKIKI